MENTVQAVANNRMTLKQMLYTGLGWFSFALGFIGIFLPLMPTTVFWILSVWLWSKGNPKLMDKVYQHPRYGAAIKAFMQYGTISVLAKRAAVFSMSVSYLLLVIFTRLGLMINLIVLTILAMVAIWIMTRPTEVA